MRERGGELVAADEPTVFPETLLDAIVMEDGQSGARLANSARTNKSDWGEIFGQNDDFLGQLSASEVDPRWWRWWFSEYARCGLDLGDGKCYSVTRRARVPFTARF